MMLVIFLVLVVECMVGIEILLFYFIVLIFVGGLGLYYVLFFECEIGDFVE